MIVCNNSVKKSANYYTYNREFQTYIYYLHHYITIVTGDKRRKPGTVNDIPVYTVYLFFTSFKIIVL